MENFFNYIAKPMLPEDVDIWFKVNNIIPEKMDLYYDFSFSLYYLILETYLGDEKNNETKITLSDEDNIKHFEWCWDKTIDNFKKEEITFNRKGDHYDYFLSFFTEIFYNQKESKIKDSIGVFFNDLFDRKKPFTKSDLDMISSIYKSLDKNMSV
jgi:hypothetical protein